MFIYLDKVVPQPIALKLHAEKQFTPALRCLMKQDDPSDPAKSRATVLNYVGLLKPSAAVNLHESLLLIK